MTEKEQTTAFANDLDSLVERYRVEFDMTYAAVVGTLQMKQWLMCREAAESESDLPPEDDPDAPYMD